LLVNDGHADFSRGPSLRVEGTVLSTCRVDFDGDGIVDLALRSESQAPVVQILQANKTGAFHVTHVVAAGHWSLAGTADFDRDGRQDFLVESEGYVGAWPRSADGFLVPNLL